MFVVQRKKFNFTLLELIIVIAIIGILVSLLLPSMKKARYNAQLAVCLSNTSQIGKGLTAASMTNDNKWPHRDVKPGASFVFNYRQVNKFDNIPSYEDYIDGSLMACPLSNYETEWDKTASYQFKSYVIFSGWKYSATSQYMKFNRGDTLVYNNNEFDVLVGDTYFFRNNRQLLSHPDNDSSFSTYSGTWSNQLGDARYWGSDETLNYEVPPADMNYCFTDGSAKMFKNVSPKNAALGAVPDKYENNTGFGGYKGNILLPIKY